MMILVKKLPAAILTYKQSRRIRRTTGRHKAVSSYKTVKTTG